MASSPGVRFPLIALALAILAGDVASKTPSVPLCERITNPTSIVSLTWCDEIYVACTNATCFWGSDDDLGCCSSCTAATTGCIDYAKGASHGRSGDEGRTTCSQGCIPFCQRFLNRKISQCHFQCESDSYVRTRVTWYEYGGSSWSNYYTPRFAPLSTPGISTVPINTANAATPLRPEYLEDPRKKISSGAIAGIGVGALVGGILLTLGGFFIYKRHKDHQMDFESGATRGHDSTDDYRRSEIDGQPILHMEIDGQLSTKHSRRDIVGDLDGAKTTLIPAIVYHEAENTSSAHSPSPAPISSAYHALTTGDSTPSSQGRYHVYSPANVTPSQFDIELVSITDPSSRNSTRPPMPSFTGNSPTLSNSLATGISTVVPADPESSPTQHDPASEPANVAIGNALSVNEERKTKGSNLFPLSGRYLSAEALGGRYREAQREPMEANKAIQDESVKLEGGTGKERPN